MNGGGSYGLTNKGLLEQTGGGNDYVTEPLTNSGVVTTTNGSFYLTGPVDNTGTIQSAGGFMEVQGGVLGGTYQNLGGNMVLVGTYSLGGAALDSVVLNSVYLGWQGDGAAVLDGRARWRPAASSVSRTISASPRPSSAAVSPGTMPG